MRTTDEEFVIIPGQVGDGPVATHPMARLEPAEQALLAWLVEEEGGGLVTLDECVCKLQQKHMPRFSVEEIERTFEALMTGCYLRRDSEAPVTCHVTPAGFDAAIGYGALALPTAQDQDTRKETIH